MSRLGWALSVAVVAVVGLAAYALVGRDDDAAPVAVADAWTRPTPPGVDVTAVYFELTLAADDRLIGVDVESAVATAAGVHRNDVDAAGRSAMTAVAGLDLTGGETVAFTPASDLHVMVEGLVAPLADGDGLTLVLRFEQADELAVEVETRTDR